MYNTSAPILRGLAMMVNYVGYPIAITRDEISELKLKE
jgi:hypothetical protein